LARGGLAKGLLCEAGQFLRVQDYKNVERWTDAIAQRPASLGPCRRALPWSEG
jgi:glutathione S-transferase